MPLRKVPVMLPRWILQIPPGLRWGQMYNRARQFKRKQVVQVRAAEMPRMLLVHLLWKASLARKAANCLKIVPLNLRNKRFVPRQRRVSQSCAVLAAQSPPAERCGDDRRSALCLLI